jgi:sigma-B regulation protein RsbU (phosphoserine phosphatase)
MRLRNKLLILLLIISLVPLLTYFLLNFTFSLVVRHRIENTLKSALEERAKDSLAEIISHYEDNLTMSAQAIRYGLHHYADQVQRSLWSMDISPEQPRSIRYLIRPRAEDLSKEASKYRFVNPKNNRDRVVDFGQQLFFPEQNRFHPSQLSALTDTCHDIYSINPGSKLWIYTVMEEGAFGLYPSPGSWPYEEGYDLRLQPWYLNAHRNRQMTPTARIEPLTGRSVMTVAVPIYERDNSFAGAVGMDIDLSNTLDRMVVPEEWQDGAWKLLIRLPANHGREVEDANIICCTSILQSQVDPGVSSRLIDICDPDRMKEMIENSLNGKAGTIRTPFKGVDSIWAYGSVQPGGGFPILVVPYERIIEQADNAQQVLFRNNIRGIQIFTILIFFVIVTAIVLAILKTRNLTVPITHLADASSKLAQGDYNARVTITTNDELQLLGEVFNQVGPRLQERQKIKQSLELARQIQQHFLPTENFELDHFEIVGTCTYCDETGGDYFDLFDLRTDAPGRIGLVLGDVSGHGIPAAMLMISTGSILRNNAPRHGDNLAGAILELNRHLVKNSEPDKFMTLFYGLLDDEKKTLSWTSAGHDPAIWYHAQSSEFCELENTGMPLGILDDVEFDQTDPIALQAGDVVIIGTDGIWEARNPSDEFYGKERLLDLIAAHKDETAEQIASTIVESVLEFCSDTPPADDITLVVIKCKL